MCSISTDTNSNTQFIYIKTSSYKNKVVVPLLLRQMCIAATVLKNE